ncbi:MAG: hypothetical protein L3J15_02045 [Devosiaceae bacterium]|nr:hypothetical protein [Devosiaceae bacterium]
MPIIINKKEISDDEVHAEMQHHQADSLDEARHKAAQALVVKELLLQKAYEEKLLNPLDDSEEAKEKAIDALLKAEVKVPAADDVSCSRYYEQNQQRFMDKKTGNLLPLESVKTHIQNYLHTRSLQTGISQYIKILARQAKIAGFEIEGSDNPLVQ